MYIWMYSISLNKIRRRLRRSCVLEHFRLFSSSTSVSSWSSASSSSSALPALSALPPLGHLRIHGNL